jgi:hypothetical protein
LPSYNTNGLPLVTNLIELVTADSVASGRHAGLTPGHIAVFCWPGQPADPQNDVSDVQWIDAENWMPYQKKTFVTPAFPGYISGHATFSRSAAEVMTAFTGSPFFPGGLGSYTISQLANEAGPTQPVTLQWATYYDAADQAGLSRIFGGIHPPIDNLGGRLEGEVTGTGVWEVARKYFDGSITNVPFSLALRKLNSGQGEVRYNTLRGMYYRLQATTNLSQPMVDVPGSANLAVDSSLAITNNLTGTNIFYRAVRTLKP